MPEKTSPLEFKTLLNSLTGVVYEQTNDKPKTIPAGYGSTACEMSRLCECCGASAYGYRTFNSVYATNIVPEKEVGRWDTKQIIVSGPIGKEDLPVLPTGRNFMRLKGDEKDFLITWETQ